MVELNPSAVADIVWMLALCAMTVRSLRSYDVLPAEAMIPLQWGPDGDPTLMTSRDLAVLITPMLALVGGLLLAAGERMAGDHAGLGLMVVRFVAPIVLVVAHVAHMRAAVKSVAAPA